MDGNANMTYTNYDNYLSQYPTLHSGSIKAFEYTRKATWRIDQVLSSQEFEERDTDCIFSYLLHEVDIISFGEYLKRYIYKKSGMQEAFEEVSLREYQDVVRESFRENHTPFAWQPTSRKPGSIIKRWLTQHKVLRQTVFLIAFGLRMSEKDVSDFLTKGIQETDFNFYDPGEVVCWHCFHCKKKYADYLAIMDKSGWGGLVPASHRPASHRLASHESDSHAPASHAPDSRARAGHDRHAAGKEEGFERRGPSGGSARYWEMVGQNPQAYLFDEEKLLGYLSYLRWQEDRNRSVLFEQYRILYDLLGEICFPGDGDLPSRIENQFCSGIPRDPSDNLTRIKDSLLAEVFAHQKMSRQRIDAVLKGRIEPSRFDLITFLFFIYSQKDMEPNLRRDQFIFEMNDILIRCHLTCLLFTIPYEAFIIMCLMTDDPLASYSEVWEMSYRHSAKYSMETAGEVEDDE